MSDADRRSRWDAYLETVSDDVAALETEYPERRSLWIDVIDLYDYDQDLADALFRSPDETLETAAAVLRERLDDPGRVTVRVENHPALLGVEDLRARHLGELVSVEGLIRRPRRRARLATAHYRCHGCGTTRTHTRRGLSGPGVPSCPDCGSDGLALETDASTFLDTQIVHLEPPSDADTERSLVAHLDDDLAGAVDRGTAVVLTGVLRPDREVRSNVFDALLSALSVEDATTGRRERPSGLDGLIDAHWSGGDRRP